MGFFKDLRQLKKTADELTPPEHRGIAGGFRALRDTVAEANEILGDMQEASADAQRLQTTGRPGTAVVLALRDTGASVNDNPQVELDLQVTLDGVAPYNVTHRQVISRLATASFQPGASVGVKVDPQDLQKLIVV
jgi:hypothetical protein